MGLITHIVIFKLHPTVSDAERHLLASRFLALQDRCELDGKKYLTVTGGKNNSKEGFEKGLEQAFVVTFETEKARDYYVDTDPAHNEFKELVKDKVADLLVVDFEQGVFCSKRQEYQQKTLACSGKDV
ncbi:hypothetical protein JCM11641_008125 [Rhodosporidiobolus odoratus]